MVAVLELSAGGSGIQPHRDWWELFPVLTWPAARFLGLLRAGRGLAAWPEVRGEFGQDLPASWVKCRGRGRRNTPKERK